MSTRLSVLCSLAFAGIVSSLTFTSAAHADLSKYSCHALGGSAVVPLIEQNACVGYKQLDASGITKRTVKFPFMGSGRMVSSEDGRSVIMLQSYMPGVIDKNGDVSADVTPNKNPVAIWVYRDGQKIKTHRLLSLIARKKLIRQSISHLNWLRKDPSGISSDTLVIHTTDFREVTINTKTGAFVSRIDDPAWVGCDVIATGTVDTRTDEMKRAFLPKTFQGSQTIRFVRGPNLGKLGLNTHVTGCFDRAPAGKLVFIRVVE